MTIGDRVVIFVGWRGGSCFGGLVGDRELIKYCFKALSEISLPSISVGCVKQIVSV